MARHADVDTRLVIDHLENRCLPSADFGLTELPFDEGLAEGNLAMTPPESSDEWGEQSTSAMVKPEAMATPDYPGTSESAYPNGGSTFLAEQASPAPPTGTELYREPDDSPRLRNLLTYLNHSDIDWQLLRWKHEALHGTLLAYFGSRDDLVDDGWSATGSAPKSPSSETTDPAEYDEPAPASGTNTIPTTVVSSSANLTRTSETKPSGYQSPASGAGSTTTIESSSNTSAVTTTESSTAVGRTKYTEPSPGTASSTDRDNVISEPSAGSNEPATNTGLAAGRVGDSVSPPTPSVEGPAAPPSVPLAVVETVPVVAPQSDVLTGESTTGSPAPLPTNVVSWTGPGIGPMVAEMRALGDRAAGTGLGMVSAIVKQVAGALAARPIAESAVAEQAPTDRVETGLPALPELLAGVSDLAPDVLLGGSLLADPQLHALPPSGTATGVADDAEGIVRELAASVGVVAVSATVDRFRRKRKASAGLLARCSDWLRRTLRLDGPTAERAADEADTRLRSSAAAVSRDWIRLDDTEVAESSNAIARPGTTPWTMAR